MRGVGLQHPALEALLRLAASSTAVPQRLRDSATRAAAAVLVNLRSGSVGVGRTGVARGSDLRVDAEHPWSSPALCQVSWQRGSWPAGLRLQRAWRSRSGYTDMARQKQKRTSTRRSAPCPSMKLAGRSPWPTSFPCCPLRWPAWSRWQPRKGMPPQRLGLSCCCRIPSLFPHTHLFQLPACLSLLKRLARDLS